MFDQTLLLQLRKGGERLGDRRFVARLNAKAQVDGVECVKAKVFEIEFDCLPPSTVSGQSSKWSQMPSCPR